MPTEIFSKAQNVVISNSNFINNSQSSSAKITASSTGLQTLLGASIPDAAHDSSARYPPPQCHPGTRKAYIEQIAQWSSDGEGVRHSGILWMKGFAGIGKSAVAQTCAEALGDRIGATFFFSGLSRRDDPNRFFTSLSYQLATKHEGYRNIIGKTIYNDPTLVTKSIRKQFQDLFVVPLQELETNNDSFMEKIIIIDGLDECDGGVAQQDIVEIIAASVRAQATPFRWAFFSRPETHLIATFSSPAVSPFTHYMELPISRETDSEIAQYLTDKLEEIRKECQVPSPWPSNEVIRAVVKLSGGLFIYAATIVRFVREPDAPSPKDQLSIVLSLTRRPIQPWTYSRHPLSELDAFYTLIMQRIPSRVLQITQKILLVATLAHSGRNAVENANLLGLSEVQFFAACRGLRSILSIEQVFPAACDRVLEPRIRFYHASFVDFLNDPTRSKEYCISRWAATLRRELLEKLTTAHEKGSADLTLSWASPDTAYTGVLVYFQTLELFFRLCQSTPLDDETIEALVNFDYRTAVIFTKDLRDVHPPMRKALFGINGDSFWKNIPEIFRHRIIRPYQTYSLLSGQIQRPDEASRSQPYVLGNGQKRALIWKFRWDHSASILTPFPASGWGSLMRSVLEEWVVSKATF